MESYLLKVPMMLPTGALSTYSLISKVSTLSTSIQELISKSELTHQDKLNFRSLERRLLSLQEPLSFLLIMKQNQEIEIQRA